VELPNGGDPVVATHLATAPSPHPWAEDKTVPLVVTIGRLRPQKNLDLLIAGLAVARRQRRLRLAIIGGGSPGEEERLRALAAAAGIGEDFLLAGETDNVFAWLARANVFALTSRWEGSSVALLEALAVGTPIIASRLAGDAAAVLDDGRHGLLFDGHSPDELAAALLRQTSANPLRPTGWQAGSDASIEGYARTIADILAEAAGPVTPHRPRLSSAA
jgi:glycosyltransferase involved in cell wall biosynthesis